jgi:imidazole glycerol-phosphate synthase subunit HisF
MRRPRVVVILTISKGIAVKTASWRNPENLGDPINAAQIYSDLGVDELIISDITASKSGAGPDMRLLRSIASNSLVPLGYIGGVATTRQATDILRLGYEKIGFGEIAQSKPEIIADVSKAIGTQSVFVAIDKYTKRFTKKESIRCQSGSEVGFEETLRSLQSIGAGEFVVTSMEREGTWAGYDLDLVRRAAIAISVPLVANGGAGNLADLRSAAQNGASAVAASSLFLFRAHTKEMMISYPTEAQFEVTFST